MDERGEGLELDGKGLRLRARWRLIRGTAKTLAAVSLVVALGLGFLVQTALGHRLVLGWALDQARARIGGTLDVAEIRSATLFKGARLIDIRLTTPDGEAFVVVDSLEASWSLPGLLAGALSVDDITIWAPRVTLEQDAEATTLGRWLRGNAVVDSSGLGAAGGDATGGAGGAPDASRRPTLNLSDLRVVDGDLRLRLLRPARNAGSATGVASEPARSSALRVEEHPDGPRLAIDAHALQGLLPRVRLGGEGQSWINLRDVSGQLEALQQPVEIEELAGQVRLGATRTVVALQRVQAPGLEGGGMVVVTRAPAAADVAAPEVVTDLAFDVQRFEIDPWRWLLPLSADVSGRARFEARLARGATRLALSEVDASVDGGTLAGEAALQLAAAARPELRFEGIRLNAERIPLASVLSEVGAHEALLELAPESTISGRLSLAGPPDALEARGELMLEPLRSRETSAATGDRLGQTAATFDGVILSGEGGLGVRGFSMRLAPFDWRVLSSFVPGLELAGPGSLQLSATGRLDDGLRIDLDAAHRAAPEPHSRLLMSGSVRREVSRGWVVDMLADLSPLSLEGLLNDAQAPLQGAVTGTVRMRGPLDALELRSQLQLPSGELDLAVAGNLLQPAQGIRLEAEGREVNVAEILAGAPDPSRWSGRVDVAAVGSTLSDLVASAHVEIADARVGQVDVAQARLTAGLRDGQLAVDTVEVFAEEFTVSGAGALGLDSTSSAGTLRLVVAADSLTGLRSLVRGNGLVVADGLSVLDREVLALRGIDADTLPSALEARAEGRVRGVVMLTGAVRSFDTRASLRLDDVAWGPRRLGRARLRLAGTGLPRLDGGLSVELDVDSLEVLDRTFTRGRSTLDFAAPNGRATLDLARGEQELYRLSGGFTLDSAETRVDVEAFDVRIDSLRYSMPHAARFAWSESQLLLDSLTIQGNEADPVHIRARGRLARSGEEAFSFDIDDLRLDRLLRVVQREDLPWSGVLAMSGQLGGDAERPRLAVELEGVDVRLDDIDLGRTRAQLSYDAQQLGFEIDAWQQDRRLLAASGVWPIDLSLGASRRSMRQAPAAIQLTVDSLPAAYALTLLEDLERVEGVISGEVEIGGTPERLEPDGQLTLSGGAWTVGAIGVRQSDAQLQLRLNPDLTVALDGGARAGGDVRISGELSLEQPRDPQLTLTLDFDRFTAVDRRDIRGAVSGNVQLEGSYAAPLVQGRLQVDRGDVFLEEFQRSLSVVDLSDPRFFAIDTTLVQSQALLASTRNPFLDNLLVIIDLGVRRNAWLRSPQLNVEMQGDLSLTFDRRERDVVFVGELQAVRGQYQVLNRTFDVERGTVEFVGIPGINPNLDIEAVARVRRRDGDPLDITATVGGTLVEPTVELASSESAVAESDLLSYLAFGQSSAQTSTGNAGAVVSQAGTAAAAALGGTLTSSLAALAQGTGFLDYLSITQAVDATAAVQGSALSTFAGTQIEVGRYFGGGDYFGALMLRPLARVGARGSLLGGARIEWQASDQYHLEVFAEDQFLRVGALGAQDLGLNSFLIYGLALFREWGY